MLRIKESCPVFVRFWCAASAGKTPQVAFDCLSTWYKKHLVHKKNISHNTKIPIEGFIFW
jgi:predicted RNase H-like HicB family nuclease